MAIITSLPAKDCAELSLFGPGVGECMLLHYGEGQWFVIDSCLCPETKTPIALKYLKELGVDVSTQVSGILLTHWHRDHIDGAFELLKACRGAKLYCSAALSSRESLYLAMVYTGEGFTSVDKEIKEFSSIVKHLYESKEYGRLIPVSVSHLFYDHSPAQKRMSKLVALSPSNVATTQAIANIVNMTPKAQSERLRRVAPVGDNYNSVAMHFSFGDFSALLGADLEDNGNINTGWSAIIGSGIAENLSLAKSSIYKVAHHGSSTGHLDQIWTELLNKKPLSITTAYSRSSLPTKENIDRICKLSSQFVVTRDPSASKKKVRRDSMVEREMMGVVKSRQIINEKMGHIQIRVSKRGEVTLNSNQACKAYSA